MTVGLPGLWAARSDRNQSGAESISSEIQSVGGLRFEKLPLNASSRSGADVLLQNGDAEPSGCKLTPASEFSKKGVDWVRCSPYTPRQQRGWPTWVGLRFAPHLVGSTGARHLQDRDVIRVGSLTLLVKMKGHAGGGSVSWSLRVQGDR